MNLIMTSLGLLIVEGNTFMQKFGVIAHKLTPKTTNAMRMF